MMNKRRYRGALWGWMALGAVVILLWGRVVYDSAEQGKVAMREMAEKSLQEVAELELNRAFKKQKIHSLVKKKGSIPNGWSLMKEVNLKC